MKGISRKQKQISYKDSFFEFQLEIFKMEINQIKEIVARIDEITLKIKGWTVFIWAGSFSLIISNSNVELRKYILFITIIPFLFWIIDAEFRRRQRQFLYRNKKNREFINSENLEISFRQNKMSDFILFDPKGKQYSTEDVKNYANTKKTMLFKSVRVFYLGLIIVTIFMQIVLYHRAINYSTESTISNECFDGISTICQNVIINEPKYSEEEEKIGTVDNEKEPKQPMTNECCQNIIMKKIETIEGREIIRAILGNEDTFLQYYTESLIHKYGTLTAVCFANSCLLNGSGNNKITNFMLGQLYLCKINYEWLYILLTSEVKHYSVC